MAHRLLGAVLNTEGRVETGSQAGTVGVTHSMSECVRDAQLEVVEHSRLNQASVGLYPSPREYRWVLSGDAGQQCRIVSKG